MNINGVNFTKLVDAAFFDGTDIFKPSDIFTYGLFERNIDQKVIQDKMFSFFNVKTKGSEVESDKLGKMFFSKSATVPRYKIREVKDKYNISVVRDSTKADTIVISKDEVMGNTTHSWGQYIYKKEDVANVLEACLDQKITGDYLRNYRPYRYSVNVVNMVDNKDNVREALDKLHKLPADVEYISFSYGMRDKFNALSEALNFSHDDIRTNVYIIDQAVLDNFTNYKDKNIITDSSLQSILGSSDMEHENYVFIDQLLNSNDPGNVELGLTLMANCNFEGSQHYLLILLGDHFNKHRYVKYCQSVAFKSLLDFMNFSKYSSVTLDNVLDKADSMGKLTDEIKDLVYKRAIAEFEYSFRRYRWITVKGIEIAKPKDDTNQGGN